MSLTSSLYAGVSGLTTNSQELGVVGDNIANANTIGFKKSRASFEDMMSQSLIGGGSNGGQIGMGAKLATVQKILTQGALTTTGVATDMALQGPGFFVVETPGGPAYTRNGQFTIDQDGFMSTLGGQRVQGFGADPVTGAMNGAMADMQVGNATYPSTATTAYDLRGNLNPTAAISPGPFDLTDIAGTSDPSAATPIEIVDSLGNTHDATIHYTKLQDGLWTYNVVTDGAGVGGNPDEPVIIASGELAFNTDGELEVHTPTSSDFTPTGATQPQPLTFNFFDPETGDPNYTQMGGQDSSATFVSHDGIESGTLTDFFITDEGAVTGVFSNGETRALAHVAIADFPAADQLSRQGGNFFAATPEAGDPTFGIPGSGGRGRLAAGTLEQSNVDLSEEFVRMIVAQRGFQASSKTVTTADTLLGELVQLKR